MIRNSAIISYVIYNHQHIFIRWTITSNERLNLRRSTGNKYLVFSHQWGLTGNIYDKTAGRNTSTTAHKSSYRHYREFFARNGIKYDVTTQWHLKSASKVDRWYDQNMWLSWHLFRLIIASQLMFACVFGNSCLQFYELLLIALRQIEYKDLEM